MPLPALMLHGFTGAGSSWAELAGALSPWLTAICPDLPGHAGAPVPKRLGREGFDETIEALAARLTGPSVVIGYSQGARLALALAVRHPRKVSRLILESGTAGLARHHDRALRRAEDEERAMRLEAHGVEAFIAQWEQLPLFDGLRRSAALDARRRAHTASGLAGALRCLGLGVQPSFWSALPRLAIPTLMLSGAEDAKFTALAGRMAAQLPQGWHVAIKGAGHAVHLQAPKRWLAEVQGFLGARYTHEHHDLEVRT